MAGRKMWVGDKADEGWERGMKAPVVRLRRKRSCIY